MKNKTFVEKITKEQYDSLVSPDIKMFDYNRILDLITKRFDYIIQHISEKVYWWDYLDETFFPQKYKDRDYITFEGEYNFQQPYRSCPDIPICWLWTDFEEDFKRDVEQYKNDEDKRKCVEKENLRLMKERKDEMKKSISAKLTKEELKFISFK